MFRPFIYEIDCQVLTSDVTFTLSAYIDQNVSLKDRNQIEELMIKGDLIELHLEETTDLWNLLSMFFVLFIFFCTFYIS